MTIDYILSNLPSSWEIIQVGENVKSISLTGKKLKQREYQESGRWPVIDQGKEFIGGYTDRTELVLNIDFPVIVFGDHTKEIKYIDFKFVPGADGVKVLKPNEVFYPKLFYYLLQAIQLPDKGYARHYQFLAKSRIPLPPLPEQKRIVAKIEELFTQLDAGVSELQKAKAQLKHYRQAVLKAAVEGELTREWREAHQDVLEPASELLERILTERREKWEEEELANMRDKGKELKNDMWKRRYKELGKPDFDNLLDLPDGWAWGTLEQLSTNIVDCLHSTPKFTSSGKYCIDTTCIAPGKILFKKVRYVSDETYNARVRRLVPKTDDVLFSREGTIGTALLVPEHTELCLGQRMMMFRPVDIIYPKYFMYAIQSGTFVRQWKPKVTGTTSPHVNIGELRMMSLPLPNYSEQEEIISKIERRFSVADEIEHQLEQGLVRSERLRQSILKQAFEGKLVPQDLKDEPATGFIEQIKAKKKKTAVQSTLMGDQS